MPLIGTPESARKTVGLRPDILAVTPDDRLYSTLLYIATLHRWDTKWVKSTERASELIRAGRDSVVLYDWHPRSAPWEDAFQCLRAGDPECCVVLAVPDVNEAIWAEALRLGIYDVVPRSGHSLQLGVTLAFAWAWKSERRTRRGLQLSLLKRVLAGIHAIP
jgi:DNA-binding NtrC family response regulator